MEILGPPPLMNPPKPSVAMVLNQVWKHINFSHNSYPCIVTSSYNGTISWNSSGSRSTLFTYDKFHRIITYTNPSIVFS